MEPPTQAAPSNRVVTSDQDLSRSTLRSRHWAVGCFVLGLGLIAFVVTPWDLGPSYIANNVALNDLTANVVPLLRRLPNVARVTRSGPDRSPTHRIIHVCDWHMVSREDHAADLSVLSDKPSSDEDFEQRYAVLVADVTAVQAEQMELLRAMSKRHVVTHVHYEGLIAGNEFILEAMVQSSRAVAKRLASVLKTRDELLADGGTRCRNTANYPADRGVRGQTHP